MERVRAIESGTHVDTCEGKVRDTRREIAAAVDAVWPEIEARGASLAEAKSTKRVRLGPTYVREGDAPPPVAGWTTRERSWDALAEFLAERPARPAPVVDEGWITLAREARALLVFDTARVVAGVWRDTTHTSLPPHAAKPDAAVTREGDALTVLLDAGPFERDKAKVAAYIEGVWTSKALAVRVRWTSQATKPNAYRFELGDTAGEPSHVSEKHREILLNPDVRAHAIAHEIGHVLGFADRYAKTYEMSRCAYLDEREPSDIMSDPDGPVTAEEWALLAAAYPKK